MNVTILRVIILNVIFINDVILNVVILTVIILNVIFINDVILNVIILTVVILNVNFINNINLNVVMLSVAAYNFLLTVSFLISQQVLLQTNIQIQFNKTFIAVEPHSSSGLYYKTLQIHNLQIP